TFGGGTGGSGVSNLESGIIGNAITGSLFTALTYSNIEQFNITGSSFDDKLKAKAGDTLDGGNGRDTLTLDFADATKTVVIDLTQTTAQVSYGTTQIQNFEAIDKIVTGSADDSIKLSTTASRSAGKVDGGAGKDTLILDYSTYGTFGGGTGGSGVSNLESGIIGNAITGSLFTALTYSNIEQFNI
ncbi:MAG: hypothetical protein ACKPGW_16350, partial [Microcystis panniformis]